MVDGEGARVKRGPEEQVVCGGGHKGLGWRGRDGARPVRRCRLLTGTSPSRGVTGTRCSLRAAACISWPLVFVTRRHDSS